MVNQEKKVVEQVTGWFQLYDDGSVDRSWTAPFMSEVAPPHDQFIDSVSVRDITTSSNLKLRLYLPESPDTSSGKGFPVIVHFHGGGFCISQADWGVYYPICTRLARLSGAAVVSVFLRLAPENRLPAAADDAYEGLRWLVQSRPEALAGADFSRVFLIGDSSGGNLVHATAARAVKENLDGIAGLIPIHPGFVRSGRSRSETENPETPFLTLEMADKFLAMALPVGSTKGDHPMTCPVASELPRNMPPMMLCLADKDLFWDTQMEYCEAMKRVGNEVVEVFVSHGVTHSFYLNKLAVDNDPVTARQTDLLFDAIVRFIKTH